MHSTFPSISVRQSTSMLQRELVNSLPKKLCHLANFGIQALVNMPFVSCNANARMTGSGTTAHAAEMRMCRLLKNKSLAMFLMSTIQRLMPLDKYSVLNIDFSNFGNVAVLVAALQTRKGRALPWALEALTSNTQGTHASKPGHTRHKIAYRNWRQETGGDQYDAVLRLVSNIDRIANISAGLVFDRGFGNKRLLSALFARSGNSYIRMRDDFKVEVVAPITSIAAAPAPTPTSYVGIWYVRELPIGSYDVIWRGLRFRLVVTATDKTKRSLTPWAIATNDHTSPPEQIARLYYHRFEIEETFRDWKSVLGLRRAHLHNWQSLQVLLSFASIATLFAWFARRLAPKQTDAYIHPKKRCSFFKRWHEQLQSGLRQKSITLGG